MKRKEFIKLASTGALGISSLGYLSCQVQKELFFKLSLAQWSLHKAIQSGKMDPYLFAQKSSELGFTGLEYVNQLYDDVMKSEDANLVVLPSTPDSKYLGAHLSGLTDSSFVSNNLAML